MVSFVDPSKADAHGGLTALARPTALRSDSNASTAVDWNAADAECGLQWGGGPVRESGSTARTA